MSDTQTQQERRHYLRRNNDQMQDEISLIELYQVLIRRKIVIAVTLAATLALSIVYLLLTTKVYQVEAMLLEPTADQIVLTNSSVVNPNLDIKNVKPLFESKDVFEAYKIEVKKQENWNLFIEKYPEFFTNEKTGAVAKFQRNPLSLAEDKDYPGPHLLLEFDTVDKERADRILGQYLNFARGQLTTHLIKHHKQKVGEKLAALKLKIKTSRTSEKVNREDEITRLESDLAIATKLNIKDNKMLAVQDKSSLTVVASNMNIPRYMRGTRVLSAELEALKNRKSDDAFIKGLRDWQQEVVRLKLITYLPENFEPYILDGAINKPESPIKPKRSLVLALAVVLGLFLGIFAAFFFEFIRKANQSNR